MGKPRKQKAQKPNVPKKKRVQKQIQPIDNKISIKKLANQKEIVAQFAMVQCSKQFRSTQKNRQVMSIPVFRRDNLDYTPGFCLPDEFNQTFLTQQAMLHQFRLSSECNQIDVLNIKQPKPSSRNSYCTICKVRFQDYKEHIQLESHLAKMRGSIYNNFIEELCRDKKLQKFLRNQETNSNSSPIDCQQGLTGVFMDEQQFGKIDRRATGTNNSKESKEALYEKIVEQFKDANGRNGLSLNSENNIYDVLQV